MATVKVFCDTSFLVGYYLNSDQYHQESIKRLKTLKSENPRLVISDYIFDETMTYLLTTKPPHGYLIARIFDVDVNLDQKYEIIFVGENTFQKAREIFNRFNKDKVWSFTDCTSFALMEDYGIRQALSFDKNFSQRGFKIVK